MGPRMVDLVLRQVPGLTGTGRQQLQLGRRILSLRNHRLSIRRQRHRSALDQKHRRRAVRFSYVDRVGKAAGLRLVQRASAAFFVEEESLAIRR